MYSNSLSSNHKHFYIEEQLGPVDENLHINATIEREGLQSSRFGISDSPSSTIIKKPVTDHDIIYNEESLHTTSEIERSQSSKFGTSYSSNSENTREPVPDNGPQLSKKDQENTAEEDNLLSKLLRYIRSSGSKKKKKYDQNVTTQQTQRIQCWSTNSDENIHKKENQTDTSTKALNCKHEELVSSCEIIQQTDVSIASKKNYSGSTNENTLSSIRRDLPVIGRFYSRGDDQKSVQILVPIQTRTTRDCLAKIPSLFKRMPFKCKQADVSNLCEEAPLVVVCHICSRYETDIDNALTGIVYNRQFVVLLLHSALKKYLPKLPSRFYLAKFEKYRNIEFIDIAYNIDKKLYKCKMNKDAYSELKTFFQKFKTTD